MLHQSRRRVVVLKHLLAANSEPAVAQASQTVACGTALSKCVVFWVFAAHVLTSCSHILCSSESGSLWLRITALVATISSLCYSKPVNKIGGDMHM